MSKNLLFCTVNAGTDMFTSITIKSILKFHPNATIFVIDAFAKSGKAFSPMCDGIMDKVKILRGFDKDETVLPRIDIMKIQNLSTEEKETIISKLESNPYKVPFRGSYNHQQNIQFAIDNICENFVLIDSDAPLIRPIDFVDNSVVTVGELKSWNIENKDIRLISPTFKKFYPFVQYLNIKKMKQNGLMYYDPMQLEKYMKIAIRQKNQLWFDTGCIFAEQVIELGLKYNQIRTSDYIDHFVAASHATKSPDLFLKKYKNLLNNR